MRSLFTSLVVLLGLGFATQAFADDGASIPATPSAMPINMGNWEIGGAASYSRDVKTNQRYISVTPHAEYFFVNRFSAGGTLLYTDDYTLGTTYGLGPSATYYITHTERLALSIDQHVLWSKPYVGDNYVEGATGLALDYFLTPSIAFGPALRGYYYFNGGVNKPGDSVKVEFNFSLFL